MKFNKSQEQVLAKLETISPLWAIKIKSKLDASNMTKLTTFTDGECKINGVMLKLSNPDRCIVGEAYLFKYERLSDCVICDDYSQDCYDGPSYIVRDEAFKYNSEYLNQWFRMINRFVNHFKKAHPELYVKRLEKTIAMKEKELQKQQP